MMLDFPKGPEALELRAAIARTHVLAIESGLTFPEVDVVLDVAPGVFRGICAEAPADHPAEARLRALADLLEFAGRLLGGRAYVAGWLRTPHPLMEGRSPIALLLDDPASLRAMRDALRGEWQATLGPGWMRDGESVDGLST